MPTAPAEPKAVREPPRPPAADARPLAEDETRLCGLGVVRLDDAAPTPLDHIPSASRQAAREALGRAMATHPDARVRAAGLLREVRLGLSGPAFDLAVEQATACQMARHDGLAGTWQFCQVDAARRQAAVLAPLRAPIDQLARLAAASDDPLLHAFAADACQPHGLGLAPRPASCQLVGAAAWARHAPWAADPWLLLAAQAQAHGDEPGATLALAQAARARRIDAGAGAMVGLAEAALPRHLGPLEQAAAVAELTALDEAIQPSVVPAVAALCPAAALQVPQRRADCEAVARLMVRRGRTIDTVLGGLQLGERLGWSAGRLRAAAAPAQAAMDARQRLLPESAGWSCEAVATRRRLFAEGARKGPLRAASLQASAR